MQERVDIAVDLTPSEIVVVTMLAHLGATVLSGDREAVQELGGMIVRGDPKAVISSAALEKLEASLKAARAMFQDTKEA